MDNLQIRTSRNAVTSTPMNTPNTPNGTRKKPFADNKSKSSTSLLTTCVKK